MPTRDDLQIHCSRRAADDASVAGRLAALESQALDPATQGAAAEVMRSAGYPMPPLWERVRSLEQQLQACEARLRSLERQPSALRTLQGLAGAVLRRLRRTAPSPEGKSAPSRGAPPKRGDSIEDQLLNLFVGHGFPFAKDVLVELHILYASGEPPINPLEHR